MNEEIRANEVRVVGIAGGDRGQIEDGVEWSGVAVANCCFFVSFYGDGTLFSSELKWKIFCQKLNFSSIFIPFF